jgi:hypothetical protein
MSRRILRGDPIPSVRMWFIERMAESPDVKLSDFTELEFKFWKDIVENYTAWQANRKLN